MMETSLSKDDFLKKRDMPHFFNEEDYLIVECGEMRERGVFFGWDGDFALVVFPKEENRWGMSKVRLDLVYFAGGDV
jgi:hypothetical protein